jgi:hypothetical protein
MTLYEFKRSKMFPPFVAAMAISCGFGIAKTVVTIDDMQTADQNQYEYVSTVASNQPELAPLITNALDDNILTVGEYEQIARASQAVDRRVTADQIRAKLPKKS